jgi:purine catabolism regulator
VHPLGMSEPTEQYLVVMTHGRPTAVHRACVTTAVALLGLALESAQTRVSTEREIRSRALELAIDGDVNSASVLLAVVAGQPGLPERGRVIRARGAARDVQGALQETEARGVLSARQDTELSALTSAECEADVITLLTEAGLHVGVGSDSAAARLGRSYRQAGFALADATDLVPVVWWDRLFGEGAVALLDRPRAVAFASTYLAPLGATQVQTLQAYLRHHGSYAKIAEELGVHRNTVRTRIDQIERILSTSLKDPQTRVTAWIALHLAQEG